jgi:hypothetical protein
MPTLDTPLHSLSRLFVRVVDPIPLYELAHGPVIYVHGQRSLVLKLAGLGTQLESQLGSCLR